jgi:hypothetical protein
MCLPGLVNGLADVVGMSEMSPAVRAARARLAGTASLVRGPDRELRLAQARVELREAKLAQRIRKIADADPPLGRAVRQRLAALLTGGVR